MQNTYMIASGKGGVGKSTVASALAVALARQEQKTVLVDMDFGLRSLDIHLGMENAVVHDVLDFVRGDCKLSQAVLSHLTIPELALLPASQLGDASEMTQEHLGTVLRKLRKRYAYTLVDAPAGLRGLDSILQCAENTLLVVTPDDVSLRDAERVIDLCRKADKPVPMLIVNRVIPELVGSGDMYTPQVIADTLDAPLLGYVPDDLEVLRALKRHETVMESSGPAQQALDRIARRLRGYSVPMPEIVPPARPAKRGWFGRRQRGDRP